MQLKISCCFSCIHTLVRESNGERILRVWKLLLVIFKSSNHRNYAKEAVNLLFQYHYVFSERKRAQLLWSRCAGKNIPCDLYMEHLNRRLNTVIRGMGSNISPSRVQRAGESIAAVHRLCQAFENQTAKHIHT